MRVALGQETVDALMARIRWGRRLEQNATKFLTHLTLGVCDRNIDFWVDWLSEVSQGYNLSLSCNISIQVAWDVRIAVYPAMGIFHWSLFTMLVNIWINNYWCLNCGGRHYWSGKDGNIPCVQLRTYSCFHWIFEMVNWCFWRKISSSKPSTQVLMSPYDYVEEGDEYLCT